MSLSVNTNLSAMIALNNLDATEQSTQTSITRLSTGLRINSGADDPAGLIIGENMQSELQGISQAIQNTQNADNMAKTADGALSQVQSLLLDLRALAVNAANSGVEDTASLQADQTQVQSIIQAINRVASTTEFGTKKLLDGSAGAVGNVTAGADVNSLYVSGTFNGNTIATGPITISKISSASQATITLGNTFSSPSAIVTTSGSIVINGYSIATNGTESLQTLVAKIDAQSSNTGVTAQIAQNGANYQVVLTNNNFGSNFNISFFDPNKVLDNATSASANGTDAVFNVIANTAAGLQTVLFTGGQGGGVSGLTVSDIYGNQIQLTQAGNALATGAATQIGQVTAGSVQFQVGPDAGQAVSFSLPDVSSSNLGVGAVSGKSIADINLTTVQGANDAMLIVQQAVQQVATLRGQIGSFQKNIVESSQSFLQVANENLAASESSVMDANMASEITNYTRLQILQQSGVAVLAQANNQPQSILTLLKGA